MLLTRPFALYRCGIDEFKRSSDSWRTHAQTAAAMRSEFADLLADDDQPDQNGQSEHTGQPGQDAAPQGDMAAPGASKPKKHKKLQSASLGGAAAGQLGQQDEDSAVLKLKRKKSMPVTAGSSEHEKGSTKHEKGSTKHKHKVPRAAPSGDTSAEQLLLKGRNKKQKRQLESGGLHKAGDESAGGLNPFVEHVRPAAQKQAKRKLTAGPLETSLRIRKVSKKQRKVAAGESKKSHS